MIVVYISEHACHTDCIFVMPGPIEPAAVDYGKQFCRDTQRGAQANLQVLPGHAVFDEWPTLSVGPSASQTVCAIVA